MEQKVRILIAKPGLDGHDRGAKVVSRALRDAGFEVIYTGCHQTPEQIVRAAIEKTSRAWTSLRRPSVSFSKVVELLRSRRPTISFLEGIIPEDDIPFKGKRSAVFTPGTSTEDIIAWVRQNIKSRNSFSREPL
jgi:methylmalonyl-CoA mutase C-terminal domain/subunit